MREIMKVEERLKELRINKGLSLSEVAEAIGIEKSNISKLEHGQYKRLSCEHLLRFAKFYQVSPSYLLGVDESTCEIEPKWLIFIQKVKEQNLTTREVIISVEKVMKVKLRN